jgi:hypothetical protein
MLRILTVYLALLAPAQAQIVKVTSGEHTNFTRLVLALPDPTEWRLGRTVQGYEVKLQNAEARYNLESAFDFIPRDRLNGIYADPVTGQLQLTIGCACHAIAFQLNAETVVIDIRDGVAPETSAFEFGLNDETFPPLLGQSGQLQRPRARPDDSIGQQDYDWLDVVPEGPTAEMDPSIKLPNSTTISMREQLVGQLAAGAARSVVDLTLPSEVLEGPIRSELEQITQIRVNETIGLRAGPVRQEESDLVANGSDCRSDEELDLNQWSETDQLTGIHLGLVGEFDEPQEDVVLAAVKKYLFFGFGAEARSLLMAFGQDIKDAEMLIEMSYLLDGDASRIRKSFLGMTGCDSPAAMWAFLSEDEPIDREVNFRAIKRTFSALPAHIRQFFGPQIAEKLLAMGRSDDAMEISHAMGRSTKGDHRPTELVEAKVMLESGNANPAVEHIENILKDPGYLRVEALVQLVHAQIAANLPVDARTADSLAAMIDEFEGHTFQAEIIQAHRLALAASNQFAAALTDQDSDDRVDPRIWDLLSLYGSDDNVLELAITPKGDDIPALTAERIATRLANLGFPDQADDWREASQGVALQLPHSDRNAEPTVETNMADDRPAPEVLESNPLDSTGVPSTTNEREDLRRPLPADLARWGQDWANLAQLDAGPWGQLAGQLSTSEPISDEPSLSVASRALDNSAETRALINQILQGSEESSPLP